MPKIQKTKQGLFVYLPKEYMQLLNWNKGDTLACYPDRSAKQTLVMQKTLDAVSKEVIQSVNNYKEADPIKLQITKNAKNFRRSK
jgi:bifunctional DNA-binding transcriptional regulator/antitoxin component of YhaV-PrlF toxin-antitoxin module